MNDSASASFPTASDGPTIYPATIDAPARSPWRLTTIALILTLLLGGIGGGWLALTFLGPASGFALSPEPKAAPAPVATVAQPLAPRPAAAPMPLSPADTSTVTARLGMLEERLARITLAAESASGNAARAEALLVAFAARRAVERGFPLGSMEAQLRLRFGESQPNAVNSILSAANNPITADELATQLDGLRPVLLSDPQSGWLTRAGRALTSLVVIRRADAPSNRPTRRFEQAQQALDNGRVDEAIQDVEALPGQQHPLVQNWLNEARRYNDARRALDLIETAAILEPGSNRDPNARP